MRGFYRFPHVQHYTTHLCVLFCYQIMMRIEQLPKLEIYHDGLSDDFFKLEEENPKDAKGFAKIQGKITSDATNIVKAGQ